MTQAWSWIFELPLLICGWPGKIYLISVTFDFLLAKLEIHYQPHRTVGTQKCDKVRECTQHSARLAGMQNEFVFHFSNLVFIIIVYKLSICMRVQLLSSVWLRNLWTIAHLSPWDFPGQNTGVGYHFLLQGIFLIQRSNPLFLQWQAD